MSNLTVKDIVLFNLELGHYRREFEIMVKEYLEDEEYDGLSCDECSCFVDDLMLCSDGFENCEAGYKQPCYENCGCGGYHIGREKPNEK